MKNLMMAKMNLKYIYLMNNFNIFDYIGKKLHKSINNFSLKNKQLIP